MNCPYCGHANNEVRDSRGTSRYIRRRRECLKCRQRFSTAELPVDPKVFFEVMGKLSGIVKPILEIVAATGSPQREE